MIIDLDVIIKSVAKNNKIPNKDGIIKAYKYAKDKHAGIKRASGEEYIYHPMRVAKFVAEWCFPSEVVIAALLHDVVEDCNTPLSEIENIFGAGVANLVNTATKIDKHMKECEGLTKEEIHALSDPKLQQYTSDKALYIKIADRLDNLNTLSIFENQRSSRRLNILEKFLFLW